MKNPTTLEEFQVLIGKKVIYQTNIGQQITTTPCGEIVNFHLTSCNIDKEGIHSNDYIRVKLNNGGGMIGLPLLELAPKNEKTYSRKCMTTGIRTAAKNLNKIIEIVGWHRIISINDCCTTIENLGHSVIFKNRETCLALLNAVGFEELKED